MIVVTLLNAFVFPILLRKKIIQVDYGTFLTQIDSGKVKYVEIQDDQIAFIAINEKDEEGIYITGRMDDPELVNRLYNSNASFQK